MKNRILLISLAVALMLSVGLVGCGGEQVPEVTQYDLTISSTQGGSVTDPGEGTSTYDEGDEVDLLAEAQDGYEFVSWTGDVDTIDDVNAPSTTITMNDNYSITADFIAQYVLTIGSTVGGEVTTPGEGVFTYNEPTLINLVAEPDEDCRFVNWTGDVSTVANAENAATTITVDSRCSITANFEFECTPMVAAGSYHTVGLKSDGTVLAAGDNGYGQCGVTDWTSIIQVAAGWYHTVGLRSDGTVLDTLPSEQYDVGGWTGMIQVAAGGFHTVGLKSDGTVLAAGNISYGQCNVTGWTSIIQVAAGWCYTVGLRSDGTVVAVGDNLYGQCNVGAWNDIIQVAAGGFHTVGLKSNGTLVAVGANYWGQCDVSGWTDITQVAAGAFHTVGLRSDATVVAVGANYWGQCNVGSWEDIKEVPAGEYYHTIAAGGWISRSWGAEALGHTVALKSDGTVVAVGRNSEGQCNVEGWDLN